MPPKCLSCFDGFCFCIIWDLLYEWKMFWILDWDSKSCPQLQYWKEFGIVVMCKYVYIVYYTKQYAKFMIIVIHSTWFDFQNECVLYCGFRLFKYESAANPVELISSSARLSWKVPQSGWKFQSFKQNAFSTAHKHTHTHPFHLSVLFANFRFEFIMRSDMQTRTFNFTIKLLEFNLFTIHSLNFGLKW